MKFLHHLENISAASAPAGPPWCPRCRGRPPPPGRWPHAAPRWTPGCLRTPGSSPSAANTRRGAGASLPRVRNHGHLRRNVWLMPAPATGPQWPQPGPLPSGRLRAPGRPRSLPSPGDGASVHLFIHALCSLLLFQPPAKLSHAHSALLCPRSSRG